MDTPVLRLPSRDTRKCLFQSPEQEYELRHSATPLGIVQKRNRQISWSPKKRTPIKSPPKKKSRKGAWSNAELCSLVEFVALHKDIQSMQSSDSEWPAMNADNNYWTEASDFIKMSCGTLRGSVACRAKVVNFLRKAFPTIADAEEEFAINYENKCHDDSGIQDIPPTPASAFSLEKFQHCYLSKFTEDEVISLWKKLGRDVPAHVHLQSAQENIPDDELVKITSTASFKCLEELISRSFSRLTLARQKNCLDKLFITAAKCERVTHVETFPSLAMEAMKMLKEKGKSNVLRDFARCLGLKRPESNEPLMPVDRMPFGLIQHQIQFFCASDVRQISIPEDYYQWLETLDAEFDDRLGRVLRGPMWSGQSSDCVGDPLKARVNLAAVSKSTINRRTASSDFTDTPSIQTPAINVLKETNPAGRYWIKLDGTDVKEGLQHSMKEKWDGDVDMLDGQLSKLQEEYRLRLKSVTLSDNTDCANLQEEIVCDLNCDKTFLEKLFKVASKNLRSKISQKMPALKL
ncbi:uncharacterized protein LOC133180178 [Saccostrea echinata]|uniref:uncharacterized protein LOC133180178 n=1 Tax=Saccostrea echinata TaxID=191078 RepID=UPI002A833B2A|nr:uncharacterized protein LOC133180178 [Saccostrea echinata]